jgi:hypothetical protein
MIFTNSVRCIRVQEEWMLRGCVLLYLVQLVALSAGDGWMAD